MTTAVETATSSRGSTSSSPRHRSSRLMRRTTGGGASTSAARSTSPRSASRPSARRAGSTSSASTTRCSWARPARRSSTSSSNGAATFEIDGETIEAPAGALVHVQPTAKRKATANDDDTTILVVGGTPGKAYEPAPEEAAEAFAAYNAGDYETALAKQLVVVEKRPDDPVVHFNAGCFAARAGHADEAIGPSAERSRSTTESRSSWRPTRISTRSAKTSASPS